MASFADLKTLPLRHPLYGARRDRPRPVRCFSYCRLFIFRPDHSPLHDSDRRPLRHPILWWSSRRGRHRVVPVVAQRPRDESGTAQAIPVQATTPAIATLAKANITAVAMPVAAPATTDLLFLDAEGILKFGDATVELPALKASICSAALCSNIR